MGRKKATDKRLLVAKWMPPLYKNLPGQSYSWKTDQVLKWLSERPMLIDYLFDKLRNNGYIYFDSETKTWQGVDYDEEEE